MTKPFLLIALLAVIVYILPLNVRPMSIPDESRYAEIPREMIASGDWVVPRLDGLRYFEKPVLGYWLNAVSILAFGENNFAIRFPCAASALFSAFMIFLLVRKFTGDERKAQLTSAALLTSALVFAIGVFSVLDSMFSVFVTGTMVAFFFAAQETDSKKKTVALALCGISCGLAFLVKGFLAFALPVAALVPFLAWERRFKDMFRLPWIPAITALLVIAPWAIMIHLHEKDYWYQFFWVEHVQRFFSPEGKAQHAEPAWYFLPILAGGTFPWLLLVPAAVAGLWFKKKEASSLTRFATCWFVMLFLFFSASTGKLGTYILPCFPPLLILLTDGILTQLERGKRLAFTLGAALTALLTAGGAVYMTLSQTCSGLDDMRVYNNDEAWKWIILVVGLLAFSVLAVLSARAPGPSKRMALYAAAPLMFFFAIHFAIPKAFHLKAKECMDPAGMIARHMELLKPDNIVLSECYLVHAVCWVTKRTDIYLFESGGELDYGLRYEDSKHRQLQPAALQDFLLGTRKSVTVVTDVKDFEKYGKVMPTPTFLENTNGIVFAHYHQ